MKLGLGLGLSHAGQVAAGGDAGGSLPSGAVAHLDFVNGYYYANGSERAVTDLLVGDEGLDVDHQYGNVFDTAWITAGQGLLLDNQSEFRVPAASSMLLNHLQYGHTGVYEFDDLDDYGATLFYWEQNFGDIRIKALVYEDGAENWEVTLLGGPFAPDGLDSAQHSQPVDQVGGITKFAYTFGGGRMASCANGGAVLSETISAPAIPWDYASIGNNATEFSAPGGSATRLRLRKITIYPVKDDSELQALTL